MNKYDPAIRELAKAVLAKLRARLAGAVELVYDIGLGPSERASEAIFSVALYPGWVSLFFLHGAGLPDPQKLLRGSGKVVRSIVLGDAADLIGRPCVR